MLADDSRSREQREAVASCHAQGASVWSRDFFVRCGELTAPGVTFVERFGIPKTRPRG